MLNYKHESQNACAITLKFVSRQLQMYNPTHIANWMQSPLYQDKTICC